MTYEQIADDWRAGMYLAATRFRMKHPKRHEEMLAGVMIGYKRGEIGGFARRMQQLERACAAAEGWPSFDLYLQQRQEAAA